MTTEQKTGKEQLKRGARKVLASIVKKTEDFLEEMHTLPVLIEESEFRCLILEKGPPGEKNNQYVSTFNSTFHAHYTDEETGQKYSIEVRKI